MNKTSRKTKKSSALGKPTVRTSNTSTVLYQHLQELREDLRKTEMEVKHIKKTIDSAREDQKKYLAQDDGEKFSKTITLKNKALNKKDALEDKIDAIKSDMKSVFIFIKKGGHKRMDHKRKDHKRKSRKKIRRKTDM